MNPLDRIRSIPWLAASVRVLAAPVIGAVLAFRGLVDRRYYGRQLGRRFLTPYGAGVHFARFGILNGYASTMRWEPGWSAELMGGTPTDALLAVVRRGAAGVVRSPESLVELVRAHDVLSPFADAPIDVLLEDAVDLRGRNEAAAALEARIAAAAVDEDSLEASSSWSGIDWDEVAQQSREADLVSILIPTYNDWVLTTRAIDSLLATADETQLEIIVVDNSARPDVSRILRGVFRTRPEVTIITPGANLNFAGASNLAFARSRGARVIFFNNDAEAQRGWLPPLLARLDEEEVAAVQPLLLYPSGLIQSAGTVFAGPVGLPVHFLVEHHPADIDLLRADALHGFSALTAACLALAADDVLAARGFDEAYENGMEDVDLFLRMRESDARRFDVVPASRVVHREGATPHRSARVLANRERFWRRWLSRVFESDEWRLEGLGLVGFVQTPRDADAELPSLLAGSDITLAYIEGAHPEVHRVALRSPGGSEEPNVQALAEALTQAGAHVVVDTEATRSRRTRQLEGIVVHFSDDPLLDLQPGVRNVGVLVDGHPLSAHKQRGFVELLSWDEGAVATATRILELPR